MLQRVIPSFFDELLPQYIRMSLVEQRNKAPLAEVHLFWYQATAYLGVGKTTFRIVKTGVEAMAGYGNFTFSTLRIEADDTPAFEKWLEGNTVNPLTVLENFTGDGFKVSVSYIIDQNSFCVSIIGTKETKRHSEQGMSSWSDDLGEALAIAWYKHYIMCDGGEWPTKGRGNRWG